MSLWGETRKAEQGAAVCLLSVCCPLLDNLPLTQFPQLATLPQSHTMHITQSCNQNHLGSFTVTLVVMWHPLSSSFQADICQIELHCLFLSLKWIISRSFVFFLRLHSVWIVVVIVAAVNQQVLLYEATTRTVSSPGWLRLTRYVEEKLFIWTSLKRSL